MIENFGKGWSGPQEPPRPKSTRHKPYGLEGLSPLTKNERRYLHIGQTHIPTKTNPHTPNPSNPAQRFK